MVNKHDEDSIREDDIVLGFELLGIRKEQYPTYTDALSFAESFQICSLYSDDEVVSSNASLLDENLLQKGN